MFTKFSAASALLSLSSLIVHANAVPLAPRDTVSPPILIPDFDTVWTVGQQATVTWDTTQLPPASIITNTTAEIFFGTLTATSENLDFEHPLASGFPIINGNVTITVPNVPMGSTYIVCLFGSSDDISQPFSIVGGSNTTTSSSSTSSSSSSSSSSFRGSSSSSSSASSAAPSTSGGSASTTSSSSSKPGSSTTQSATQTPLVISPVSLPPSTASSPGPSTTLTSTAPPPQSSSLASTSGSAPPANVTGGSSNSAVSRMTAHSGLMRAIIVAVAVIYALH